MTDVVKELDLDDFGAVFDYEDARCALHQEHGECGCTLCQVHRSTYRMDTMSVRNA